MKTTQSLVKQLLDRIYTAETLKHISNTLEEITQNPSFKDHAADVVKDPTSSHNQKKSQLLFLIKTVDNPILYDFFSDILAANTYWLFTQNKIDYFDRFVQEFQMATEDIGILHLTTALDLSASELKTIADDLSTSFGYKVVLDHQINQALIGGCQVKVENLIYDFSLRTKFQQFQRQWLSSIEKTNKKVGRQTP